MMSNLIVPGAHQCQAQANSDGQQGGSKSARREQTLQESFVI